MEPFPSGSHDINACLACSVGRLYQYNNHLRSEVDMYMYTYKVQYRRFVTQGVVKCKNSKSFGSHHFVRQINHVVAMGKYFEDCKTSKLATLIDYSLYETNKM